jgi:phosphatidylglycerophosphate synthase
MKLDDDITNIIISNTNIFENIHPNIITLFGMLCNYFIFKNINDVTSDQINLYIFGLLIFVRWLSDCLDGAVARKYGKTSSLGNLLDTISDMIYYSIVFYYFMITYKLPLWSIILFIIVVFVLFNKYDIINGHEQIKEKTDNPIGKVIRFFTNNSIIVFVAFYLIVIYNSNLAKYNN